MSRKTSLTLYTNEIEPLIADLEWMLANESDPEKNQIRKNLILRLKRQQFVQTALRIVRSDLESHTTRFELND